MRWSLENSELDSGKQRKRTWKAGSDPVAYRALLLSKGELKA